MLLFWHYQKLFQLDPGVKISYDILTPPSPTRYFRPPTPPNNRWKTVVCISYLLDKIYHYIKIILVISWVVIMLLFSHYQKLSQPRVKISYDILTDSPQIINEKVLFAVHICLIRSISILTSLMISVLSSSNAFNFYTTKNYPILTRGSKYRVIFWPPPTKNQWQSFICLSYLLEKMYYYIKIIFMISWVFMMLLFCTTNTWFHKVINYFISSKLKQDASHQLILFW